VDVSENRGLDVAILDSDRRFRSVPERRVSPDRLMTIIDSLKPDVEVVAIDSPPSIGTSGSSRECELALRRRGVNIFSTPSDAERFARPFYNWMRFGQAAFEAAAAVGFPLYSSGQEVLGHSVEVFPHASDVFLRGKLPPRGVTGNPRRKREWRIATLELAGVDSADQLSSLDAVDAALAALTGLHGVEGTFEAIGRQPFFILVPATSRDRFYRTQPAVD
jgi:predicted nuclease with RNAse H fold